MLQSASVHNLRSHLIRYSTPPSITSDAQSRRSPQRRAHSPVILNKLNAYSILSVFKIRRLPQTLCETWDMADPDLSMLSNTGRLLWIERTRSTYAIHLSSGLFRALQITLHRQKMHWGLAIMRRAAAMCRWMLSSPVSPCSGGPTHLCTLCVPAPMEIASVMQNKLLDTAIISANNYQKNPNTKQFKRLA